MKIDANKRVMVRAPNWVGDAVMAVPALRELRRIFAEAEITLVAKPWVAGLFEGEELFDDVILLDDRKRSALETFLARTRELKSYRFDLAILLQNAFGAALLAKAARIPLVAGYPTDARRLLLDIVVPLKAALAKSHEVYYYLGVAAGLEREIRGESAVAFDNAHPRLRVTESQKQSGWRLLRDSGVSSDGRVCVINPGATNSRSKQWLAERFAEVADRLAEQHGFKVAIVGAEGDRVAACETASKMRSPAAMLAGKTSVAELKALLGCSSLLVSNDTGSAHVAAALGVPTVVIFGPTEHAATRPLSDNAVIVRRDVYCSPCMLRDCPIDHRCMTGVTVDDVCEAVERVTAPPSELVNPRLRLGDCAPCTPNSRKS